MFRSVMCGIAVVSVCAVAQADDLTPAPWRFSPGSTVQHWDFSSGPAGSAPDALPLNNPYGAPSLLPVTPVTWMPSFNGRNDVWDLSPGGNLSFFVPNTGNQAHQKEVWLQVTYFSAATVPPPSLVVSSNFGLFTPIGGPQITPLPNGWNHMLTRWVTPICPPFERINISPGLVGAVSLIDQVVIDTLCYQVPAPGAIAMCGIAAPLCFRRRRAM